jgi:arylsulfatase A-like enzyme
MHVTDWFSTILSITGSPLPDDRIIDGIDQTAWLTGAQETSNREGYLYWMGQELYGVRWRNFKLVLVEQKYMSDAAAKLPIPRVINLITDPHERERVSLPYLHTWAADHFNALTTAFQRSVAREPLIPMGAPVDHVPSSSAMS